MLKQGELGEMRKGPRASTPVPILAYHSISSLASPRLAKYTVSPELFAEHMAYLAKLYYTSITVTQFARALTEAKPELPGRPVILTFDDGFADFYTNVLPVLKRYDFTATLYITTAYVGMDHWLRCEGELTQPMLNWDQIVEINAAGIECGAHSHTHRQLEMLPEKIARDEIIRCKKVVEKQLGREVSSFAYPFGNYTATIRKWVRAAGYSSACTTENATSSTADDPFSLARLLVTAGMSVDNFATMLADRSLLVTDPRKAARIMTMRLVRSGVVKLKRMFPSAI